MKFKIAILSLLPALALGGADVQKKQTNELPITEISSYMDEKPIGPGTTIADRKRWEMLKETDSYKKLLVEAGKLLNEKLPETSDDLYLEFSKNGNRTRWQDVNSKRRSRIRTFTFAECLEDKGRFIAPLEEAVAEICKEKTWVMPAHDRNLDNFNGRITQIDLGSSALANDIASSYFILGDRLGEKCRKMMLENLNRRVLSPYKDMMSGKQKMDFWMINTNNWNAVCTGNVTATALTIVESREERAMFISQAIKSSKYFLDGFSDDGYCSEGLGYWNYGFGHYMMLAEAILEATHGKINLFKDRKTEVCSEFHRKIQIMNGVCPAFADCDIKATASGSIVKFINYRYGRESGGYDNLSAGGGIFNSMVFAFPQKLDGPAIESQEDSGYQFRTWFDKAGILICRPGTGTCRIGAALKGGNNNEHHNHNDIGSYVLVLGKEPVLLDPGAEIYTARTFSGKRYESKLLNSFGHPVPIVSGQLQRPGDEAKAKILKTSFSDTTDILEMDISSAYAVKELGSLRRTFTFSREGNGSLTVADDVMFTRPSAFETAIITLGTFEKKSESSILISSGTERITAEFSCDAGQIEIYSEEIKEDNSRKIKPVHIGLKLKDPVEKASIKVKFSPL